MAPPLVDRGLRRGLGRETELQCCSGRCGRGRRRTPKSTRNTRRSTGADRGLFKRSSGAHVSVTPEVVQPRQTVQATVTIDKPVDKVSSATLECGDTNFCRYR
jgi:hypothetical protein